MKVDQMHGSVVGGRRSWVKAPHGVAAQLKGIRWRAGWVCALHGSVSQMGQRWWHCDNMMLSRVSFPAPQIACNISLFLQGKRKQRRLAYFNYWN